jgi:hypothetical protein
MRALWTLALALGLVLARPDFDGKSCTLERRGQGGDLCFLEPECKEVCTAGKEESCTVVTAEECKDVVKPVCSTVHQEQCEEEYVSELVERCEDKPKVACEVVGTTQECRIVTAEQCETK